MEEGDVVPDDATTDAIRNVVFVSDLHCGCRLGLCPPGPVPIDDAAAYMPSRYQAATWAMWEEFWTRWVPEYCHNEPYAVVINGDTTDGVHHGTVTQISQNLADQFAIAHRILKPIADQAAGRFYMIRGTEAHVGPSGQEEERLAQAEMIVAPVVVAPAWKPSGSKLATVVTWGFEIVNAGEIPREYMIPDETKIGAVIRASKGSIVIPGVRAVRRESVR